MISAKLIGLSGISASVGCPLRLRLSLYEGIAVVPNRS
jgi:hypothetical protein